MKLKRFLFIVAIIFILIQILNSNAFAEDNNNFKFEKSNYLLRGEYADEAIDLVLPEGYTIKDVEITSENENIVDIIEVDDWDWNTYHRYFMVSLSVGETRLKATIKSTNYVAYCNVKVEEPIIINVSKNNDNVGATLDIDSHCNLFFHDEDKQACEISVTPLNSEKEEKWIRLGEEGIFGEALNKKYKYQIYDNCVVTVRWVHWWDGIYYDGEHEIYRKTIVIDDLKPSFSYGAFIKIYANKYGETYSNMNVGDKLKLNVEIVEISLDTPITWKSYQENVAIVDSKGVVTALREGTARIEAKTTEGMTDVYTIIVGDNSHIDVQQLLETNGAVFGIIPNEVSVGSNEQALIHGDGFNVTWSSADDKIATVSKEGLIKGISNGNVTINANIKYNNKTYQIAQEVKVSGGKTKDEYSLILSANEYTSLPSSLEVGNKIQLTAMFHTYEGSSIPRDVTTDGVIWTSSNDKIVKVDSKGLVTTVGEGNAIITAKYKVGDETITATYNLEITNSAKAQVKPGTSETGSNDRLSANGDPTTAKTIIPQTGENTTTIIMGIILIASISIIMYKKYNNYKNIK